MGWIVLGIIWIVLVIGFLTIVGLVNKDYFDFGDFLKLTLCCLGLMFPSIFPIEHGSEIVNYELDGSYELIQDSNGNYVTRNKNGKYVLTINDNGIPSTYEYSDLKISHVEADEKVKLEIVKGNWSVEKTVYIPMTKED